MKSTAQGTRLTKEFLAEGWGILFQAVGVVFHDKETWKLDEDDEANELADRTLNWARSIDKKKSAVWEKRLATWQPLLSLLMFLIATVLAPRVATMRTKRRGDIQKQTENVGARPTNPVAPATATSNGVPRADPSGNGNGRVIYRERPLRREDLQEFYGDDESGTM